LLLANWKRYLVKGLKLKAKRDAYLVLEDGSIFRGASFGGDGYAEGEVVFFTGMTGYMGVLTDPSYAGQIVVATYPLVGNYGVIEEDLESNKIQVRGFVVREQCDYPNNFRCKETIAEYLEKQNITGIEGIDTRALTKKLRNYGTMKGFITTNRLPDNKMKELAMNSEDISTMDLVADVTTKTPYVLEGKGYHVGILDLGLKFSVANLINELGCKVTVIPAFSSVEEIKEYKFDMLFLSNGPGNPETATNAITIVKEFIGKTPITGIGLGHQIISIALGGKAYKLKCGHRGNNQPVKHLATNKVFISTQNHSYAIDRKSLPKDVEVTHINLHDQTVEGVRALKDKIYCVQYYPEASPGSKESRSILNDFISLIGR